MNPAVVVRRLLNILFILLMTSSQVKSAGDSYELNNAIIADVVRTMENKNTVQEVILSDEQILEMYPELNLTISKGPPVSIMSGKIPDHLIKKMADYLFGLLQGTGEVIKPTTTTTTTTPSTTSTSSSMPTSSPEFLPFRASSNQKFFDDLAVIRDAPKTADSPNLLAQIRRKPQKAMKKVNGVSRRKSEKLWRKARMVKVIGRI